MFKKIIYWSVMGFVILFVISLFTKNGVDSFIQGMTTGFSFAVGSILFTEYAHPKGKKILKKLSKRDKFKY
jgi:FtsH-binding integral membrane protein